jgi:hypothetical protein
VKYQPPPTLQKPKFGLRVATATGLGTRVVVELIAELKLASDTREMEMISEIEMEAWTVVVTVGRGGESKVMGE